MWTKVKADPHLEQMLATVLPTGRCPEGFLRRNSAIRQAPLQVRATGPDRLRVNSFPQRAQRAVRGR